MDVRRTDYIAPRILYKLQFCMLMNSVDAGATDREPILFHHLERW